MASRFLRPSFLFNHYSRLLQEVPIPTKMITCAAIMTAADITQQFIEYRNEFAEKQRLFWKDHYNLKRTIRMIAFMTFFHVPYLHYFHKFLVFEYLKQ